MLIFYINNNFHCFYSSCKHYFLMLFHCQLVKRFLPFLFTMWHRNLMRGIYLCVECKACIFKGWFPTGIWWGSCPAQETNPAGPEQHHVPICTPAAHHHLQNWAAAADPAEERAVQCRETCQTDDGECWVGEQAPTSRYITGHWGY